eukprot:1128120_1
MDLNCNHIMHRNGGDLEYIMKWISDCRRTGTITTPCLAYSYLAQRERAEALDRYDMALNWMMNSQANTCSGMFKEEEEQKEGVTDETPLYETYVTKEELMKMYEQMFTIRRMEL